MTDAEADQAFSEYAKNLPALTERLNLSTSYAWQLESLIARVSELMRHDFVTAYELGRRSKVTGETSDGYHTFNELYEHRNLLFILSMFQNKCPSTCDCCSGMYWIADHYDGWDLLVVHEQGVPNSQISYHVPSRLRYLYSEVLTQRTADDHTFDGHTSKDVLDRLRSFLENCKHAGKPQRIN